MSEIIKLDKTKKILNGILEPYEHDSLRGTWIHGKPGTGKSRKALKEHPNAFRKL